MSRRKLDFYETPPHYIEALQRVIGEPGGRIIEPCAGKGMIVSLLDVDGDWRTNDLNPRRSTDTHFNAAKLWPGQLTRPTKWDWGITNPPFRQPTMLRIIRNMLFCCKNVAVLARLSFLEPTLTRRAFWIRHQRNLNVIVLPRYSFRKNDAGKRATDSVTCCWLVWDRRSTVVSGQLSISDEREH